VAIKKQSVWARESMDRIYYPPVKIRFRKRPPNNGIYPIMETAAQNAGITLAEYGRIAVFEKLKRDGYLDSEDEYIR
jgi:hypothetical protein